MRKLTTGEFIERGNEIHNNFYNYSESVFINMNTKLWITCPIHGPFEQKPYKHINSKHGCPECGKIKQSSSNTRYQEDVIRDFRKKHGNKFDYSSFIYKGNRIKSTIICPKHGPFEQTPSNHMHYGCLECGKIEGGLKKKYTQKEIIEKFKEKHGDDFDYSLFIYNGYNTKGKIICKICNHTFNQSPHCHINGQGCPRCKESPGIRKIVMFLTEHNIHSVSEKKYDDCRDIYPLPFDRYLPELDTLIEYDGELHYFPFYGVEKLQNTQRHDIMKDEYCRIHNIKIIRISYLQYDQIEEILNRELLNQDVQKNMNING